MALFQEDPDEIRMLEGRRKYLAGSRKRWLPLAVSALCGALCTFVVVLAYVGARHHPGSDVMVTFGDDKSYQGALYLKKVDQKTPSKVAGEEEDKRADIGGAPPFLNMLPASPEVTQEGDAKEKEGGANHEGWNAVPKVPAFVNMVPSLEKMKPGKTGEGKGEEKEGKEDLEVEEEVENEGEGDKQQKMDKDDEHNTEDEVKDGEEHEDKEKKKEDDEEKGTMGSDGENMEDEETGNNGQEEHKDDDKHKGEKQKNDHKDGVEHKDGEDHKHKEGEEHKDGEEDSDDEEHKEGEEHKGGEKNKEGEEPKDGGKDMNSEKHKGGDSQTESDDEKDDNDHKDNKAEEVNTEGEEAEPADQPDKDKDTEDKEGKDKPSPKVKDETAKGNSTKTKRPVVKTEARVKGKVTEVTEEMAEPNEELDAAYEKLLEYNKRIDSLPKRYELKSRQKIGIPFKEGILAWSTLKDSPQFSEPFGISTALDNLVFVTGCSKNHFLESQDAIAGVQKVFPHSMTYYYDLGLKAEQVKEVKTWCNVLYRKFDFDKYPDHVNDLHTYAFKPLIIKEVLNQHSNFLWIGSSFRPNTDKITDVYNQAKRYGGIVLTHDSNENVTSATHPEMFRYLPAARYKLRRLIMASAGILFCRTTPKIYWGVLYWWFMCALEEGCIAPEEASLECTVDEEKEKRRPGEYRGCHRYDQSALNILLANYFQYNRSKYVAPHRVSNKLVKAVERRVTQDHVLRKC